MAKSREHLEQEALFARAQYHPITRENMFAIEHAGLRHPIEGAYLKKRGVKRGIPDVFLAYPAFGYSGLWIEMKRPPTKEVPRKGQLTADQLIWLGKLKRVGYETCVAYTWQEAWKKIGDYLQTDMEINYIS